MELNAASSAGAERAELFRRLNEGVRDERMRIFERNIGKNMPLIAHWGGLAGVPPLLAETDVIIAGAGASLDAALDALRRARRLSSVRIIAADMALPPLLAAGITPDFVISCETAPVAFYDVTVPDTVHLLAFSGIRPAVVRSWPGPVSFYNWMVRGAYERLWALAGTQLGYLATGSTVLSQALSLARGCGVASIATFGNDMGYRRAYYTRFAPGNAACRLMANRFTPFESADMNRMRRARTHVLARDGREYATHHQFLAAKYWIEELFAAGGPTLLEFSVPGAAGENIVRPPVEKYIAYLEGR